MSTWHAITFKAVGQVLASGIRCADEDLSCTGADPLLQCRILLCFCSEIVGIVYDQSYILQLNKPKVKIDEHTEILNANFI